MKMKNDKSKFKIIFTLLVVIFTFLFLISGLGRNKESAAALDDFAKCLAEKQVVMYGADWCPHCQNEKKAFGDAFSFVNYIECPKDPKRCLAANISGYPTWAFPDGKRLIGEQGVEKLSLESGCSLPNQ